MNVYLSLENGDRGPIVVHKVGEQYYVEDGHQRVSVARALGRAYIRAKIWEYPVQIMQVKKCRFAPCTEHSAVKAYAAD